MMLSKRATRSSNSKFTSIGIAVLGVTQVSLTLLEKLMDSFPLPFVKGVVGAGVEVIKMARVIQSNKEDCEELQKLSTSLLLGILHSFSGKKAEDIPDDLKRRVERLMENFQDVAVKLKVVDQRSGKGSVGGFSRAIMYHYSNADTLKGCLRTLEWAMQEFQVTSILDSSLLGEKRHKELHEGQKDMIDTQKVLREGQKEIMDVVKAGREKVIETAFASLPSTVMPPNPRIFGRQEYVEDAIQLLLSRSSTRLAILGPGGMGKTSVALKIVHDPQVVSCFGKHVHWVPCEQATSVPLLVELLAKSLRLPTSASSDRLYDVITALEAFNALHLFLLDNFETPWDIQGKQSEVEHILAQMASIQSTSFILTMRGSQYPASSSVEWTEPRLASLTQLELPAARKAFLQISSRWDNDTSLDTLLEELDCMPLAITLMAKLACGRETVSDLLIRWRSERTSLLSTVGGDRRNSIDISIKLSLDNNVVKNTPGVIPLLSVLAMLPGGTRVAHLPDICPSINNWKKALSILDSVALTYDQSDNTYIRVLSPIASYVTMHHPLEPDLLQDLRTAYCKLAEKGRLDPGDVGFNDSKEELAQEVVNIEAILQLSLRAEAADEVVLHACISYSNYCFWNHPHTTIIEAALHIAETSGSTLLAACLQTLGNILGRQCEYDKAIPALQKARLQFLKLGNEVGAAECLKTLGDTFSAQGRYDDSRLALQEAKDTFFASGNRLGAAKCLQSLGEMLYLMDKHDEAREALQDAKAEFNRLQNLLGAARCLKFLGDIPRMQLNFDEARRILLEAETAFTMLGDQRSTADCLWSLGEVLKGEGKYEEARSTLEKAKSICIVSKDPEGTAWCLTTLGNIHAREKNPEKAVSEYQDAITIFRTLGIQLGIAETLSALGKELILLNRCNEASSSLQEARVIFTTLEVSGGVTKCDELLDTITCVKEIVSTT